MPKNRKLVPKRKYHRKLKEAPMKESLHESYPDKKAPVSSDSTGKVVYTDSAGKHLAADSAGKHVPAKPADPRAAEPFGDYPNFQECVKQEKAKGRTDAAAVANCKVARAAATGKPETA
jgi:hypothetical protein